MGWIKDRWHDLTDLDSSTWLVIAVWVAVIVVLLALIYAQRQLTRNRKLWSEQTRPNVSMFMEPHPADWHLIELVVRNFGKRTAYDVGFQFTKPPSVAEYENAEEGLVDIADLSLPDELPELAPDQEWRTVWDSALDRQQLGGSIGSRFDGVVTYYDSPPPEGRWLGYKARRRKPLQTNVVLDWDNLPPVQRLELMTANDLAKREKQKLELLRSLLAYFHVASQAPRREDFRGEIDRINRATQEIRNQWRARQLDEPTDVTMSRVNPDPVPSVGPARRVD